MMAMMSDMSEFRSAVEATASDLVRLDHIGSSIFLNLPLIYPDGSSVTVKIDQIAGGLRVSDNGFAYREIEGIGAETSFSRAAKRVADEIGIKAGRRTVFADASPDTLYRAVCDVATASWSVAESIVRRLAERAQIEVEGTLRERLVDVFGREHVQPDNKINGASASEWEVSAIIQLDGRSAIFQAVSEHAGSIYRTTSAFHDIALLEHPPALVAVVQSKAALGTKLGLLAQAGRVIEQGQSDDVFRRAAA